VPPLLLKKKKLLKLNQPTLQKKTTKKLKHKFRSEDARRLFLLRQNRQKFSFREVLHDTDEPELYET
jgi:hypothetical protein